MINIASLTMPSMTFMNNHSYFITSEDEFFKRRTYRQRLQFRVVAPQYQRPAQVWAQPSKRA